MKCEIQQKVIKKSKSVCEICLQRVGRSRSSQRQVINRRKRNISVLVGREADDAQEQIVSSALQRVVENKGKNFWLKSATGGGFKGESEEIVIGKKGEKVFILPIEVFIEIIKSLILSKKKM